ERRGLPIVPAKSNSSSTLVEVAGELLAGHNLRLVVQGPWIELAVKGVVGRKFLDERRAGANTITPTRPGDLLRLWHDADVRFRSFPALRELLARFLV